MKKKIIIRILMDVLELVTSTTNLQKDLLKLIQLQYLYYYYNTLG